MAQKGFISYNRYIYIHTYIHTMFTSKIKLITFREFVTLIGEESQPVSKKIKLQELHYLESLSPTKNKTASDIAMSYMYRNKTTPRNALFLSSL